MTELEIAEVKMALLGMEMYTTNPKTMNVYYGWRVPGRYVCVVHYIKRHKEFRVFPGLSTFKKADDAIACFLEQLKLWRPNDEYNQ